MASIIDRHTKQVTDCDLAKSQSFLYRTLLGRIILKLLVRPFVTKLGGRYMSSKRSAKKIPKFIKENNIKVEDYEMVDFKCYNDFFTRKIKDGARQIDIDPKAFISPCDSKLSIYKINKNSIYEIKGAYYKISDLINNEEEVLEYQDGYCLVFRLTVDDYHRYCYVDSGTKTKNTYIKGEFHTVNPIALEKYNFFKRNAREYTILNTDNFGKLIQIEVGALMVGKISNHHEEYQFFKGEEKGMFLFGGSTIVILTKNNIKFDEDIIKNTIDGNETRVLYGEKIGCLIDE